MTVGWYVHHHGRGHLHRFLAVREHLPGRVVGMGSLPRPDGVSAADWVELPSDVGPDSPDDPTAGGALHWAPRRVPGLRERTAAIAAWVQDERPDVLVVDVSAEVALLGRLLSVPVVVIGQRGDRRDRPHAAAWEAASAVLLAWTAATDAPEDRPPEAPAVLCGALSRFDHRPRLGTAATLAPSPRRVLLIVGAGGHDLDAGDVVAASAATPSVHWDVAGALRVPSGPDLHDHGPRADVWTLMHRADVVVGTAGSNVVAEVAAARRPLVLLPQERPFDEQARQAALLDRAGLAVAVDEWPAAARWPALLRSASAADPERWSLHHDGRGAARMAAAVSAVAEDRDPGRAAAAVVADHRAPVSPTGRTPAVADTVVRDRPPTPLVAGRSCA